MDPRFTGMVSDDEVGIIRCIIYDNYSFGICISGRFDLLGDDSVDSWTYDIINIT